MGDTKRMTWTHNGRTFVCYEHLGEHDSNVIAPLTHTVDVVTDDGPREIGSAISLMDAHALTRMVRETEETETEGETNGTEDDRLLATVDPRDQQE